MQISIKDFSSECDQIRSYRIIWSHLLNKSLMENFIFCAILCFYTTLFNAHTVSCFMWSGKWYLSNFCSILAKIHLTKVINKNSRIVYEISSKVASNKDIRMKSLTSFWCLCYLWTDLTHFSAVDIVDFQLRCMQKISHQITVSNELAGSSRRENLSDCWVLRFMPKVFLKQLPSKHVFVQSQH